MGTCEFGDFTRSWNSQKRKRENLHFLPPYYFTTVASSARYPRTAANCRFAVAIKVIVKE